MTPIEQGRLALLGALTIVSPVIARASSSIEHVAIRARLAALVVARTGAPSDGPFSLILEMPRKREPFSEKMRNIIRRLPFDRTVSYTSSKQPDSAIYPMSDLDTPWPGSAEFYREKARTLLKEAEIASDEASRATLLNLAEHWQRLAQNAERPTW